MTLWDSPQSVPANTAEMERDAVVSVLPSSSLPVIVTGRL